MKTTELIRLLKKHGVKFVEHRARFLLQSYHQTIFHDLATC